MSMKDMNFPYSRTALKALEQVLREHRALIWIDPATNNLSAKRMDDHVGGQLPPQQASPKIAYA